MGTLQMPAPLKVISGNEYGEPLLIYGTQTITTFRFFCCFPGEFDTAWTIF